MMVSSLNDKHLGGSNQKLGASGEVVVSATSDIIVKSFETYVLLLNLLRTQSFEIFTGLVKVFEFYVMRRGENRINLSLDLCCDIFICG